MFYDNNTRIDRFKVSQKDKIMMNKFNKGMDDYCCGKELPRKDPGIEYLQGWEYAEFLEEEYNRQEAERIELQNRYQYDEGGNCDGFPS